MAAYAYFDQNGNLKEFIFDKSIRQGNLNSGNQILVFMESETFDYSDKFIKCTYLDVDTKEIIGTFPIRITEHLVNEALPTFENYDPKYFVSGKTYPFIVLDVPNEVMSLSGSKALSLSMSQLINGNQQVYLVYKSMITFYVDESVIQFTQLISRSEFEFLLQKVAEVENGGGSIHYIAGDGIEIDSHYNSIGLNMTRLGEILLDALYPVGAIYISLTRIDATKDTVGKYGCPLAELGGTWERIESRFLFGSDNSHPVGGTGGEENHTLSVNEMPSHGHSGSVNNAGLTGNHAVHSDVGEFVLIAAGVTWGNMHIDAYPVGGGQAHNNMPPYLNVYMWKRVEDAEELDADLNIRLAPRSAPVVEEQPDVEESVPVVDESINAPVEPETPVEPEVEVIEPEQTEEIIEPAVTPEEDEYFEENQEEPVDNNQEEER